MCMEMGVWREMSESEGVLEVSYLILPVERQWEGCFILSTTGHGTARRSMVYDMMYMNEHDASSGFSVYSLGMAWE